MRHILKLLILILLISCESKPPNQGKKIFTYNQESGISSLDPAFARDQANSWVINMLFNGLVSLDSNLKVIPAIAKSWTISEDGLTYVFNLRTDISFHSRDNHEQKRKLTASDVKFSLLRLIDKDVASPGAWVLNDKLLDSTKNQNNYSIIALNDSVVEILLKKPYSPFLQLLTMPYCSIVSEELVNKTGKGVRDNPIGTGPFKLRSWIEGETLILEKNESYFEKTKDGASLPLLDGVKIDFNSDKQTVFLKFLQGKYHVISGLDPSFKDLVMDKFGNIRDDIKTKMNVQTGPYLNTEYLGFQLSDAHLKSPFDKLEVRQAISYAINRDQMIRYLRSGLGNTHVSGLIPLGLPGHVNTEFYAYNPEKARILLKNAGFTNGKGMPEITLQTNPSYLDLCTYVQENLKQVGIRVKIDVLPGPTLRQLISKQESAFFRGSWIADYADAENYLSLFYSPNHAPNGPNYTHFNSKVVDHTIELANKAIKDNDRFEQYSKADSIAMLSCPVVVLFYDKVFRLVNPAVKDLPINAINMLDLKRVRL